MKDNTTSQAASSYDANVMKTIPRYELFHSETLELVKTINPTPKTWLDTGCGTGTLIAKASAAFPCVRFVAADPSEAMLDIAKEKLKGRMVAYLEAGSEELKKTDSFDVITAIMSHHYLDAERRRMATGICFDLLHPNGIYVTFETIRPFSAAGTSIGLARWKAHQLASGKSAEDVEKHIKRYGTELLPITVEEHLALLRATGFSMVEILWASGLQAGFYARK